MLTIAGSGVNYYALKEVNNKLVWEDYDCIIADKKYGSDENNLLLPSEVEKCFTSYKYIKELIRDKLSRNKEIVYIVSGNPLFFSAIDELFKYLSNECIDFNLDKVNIISAESTKDYLLKKLKISENEVISLSLHGKESTSLDLSRFLLTKYTFILCDEYTINSIIENTKYIKEQLTFYLGTKMGSKDENIVKIDIDTLKNSYSINEIKRKLMPFVLLIERNYDLPPLHSNNNDFITKSGLITKPDKRILSLQALELRPNLILWDIGSGSGSVSIDAYKIFKSRVVLFEKNESQCSFINENLHNHKVAGASLFKGDFFSNNFHTIKPDRIFIGGGGISVLSRFDELFGLLNPGGILVANIISLESLATIVNILSKSNYNYKYRSINIDNYVELTNNPDIKVSHPENTLFQVVVYK